MFVPLTFWKINTSQCSVQDLRTKPWPLLYKSFVYSEIWLYESDHAKGRTGSCLCSHHSVVVWWIVTLAAKATNAFVLKLNFLISLNSLYNQMNLKKSMFVCGLKLSAQNKCLNHHIKNVQDMYSLSVCSWLVFKCVLSRGEILGFYLHKSHITSLNTLKFKIYTGMFANWSL